MLYNEQGKHDEAVRVGTRALKIRQRFFGTNDPWLIGTLSCLGNAEFQRHNYANAEKHWRRALTIAEHAYGPESEPALEDGLAMLAMRQRRFDEARTVYQKLRHRYESSASHDEPATAGLLNNVAAFHVAVGEFGEAAKLLESIVPMLRRSDGEDHPHFVRALTNLSSVYAQMGRLEEAEALGIQAAEACVVDDVDKARALHWLGTIRMQQQRWFDARTAYERAAELFEAFVPHGSREHASIVADLAASHAKEGDYQRAAALAERALPMYEQLYGVTSSRVRAVLGLLADIYGGQGRYDKLTAVLIRALELDSARKRRASRANRRAPTSPATPGPPSSP